MDPTEPRTFKVRIEKNAQGDKVYNCPICNTTSGTLVVTSRNPKYFTHTYNCPNKGAIPTEESEEYEAMKQTSLVGVGEDVGSISRSSDNDPVGYWVIPRLVYKPIHRAYEQMDDLNKKALGVLTGNTEDGSMDDFVKHVFTDEESGERLSYSEMRMRYG